MKKLKKKKGVVILSFKTLYGIEKKSHQKLKIIILKFIGVKIVHYKNLTKISNKYKLSKKKIIKFYLIKVPRSRNFDRLIRLFIDLILIKFIKKFSPTLR